MPRGMMQLWGAGIAAAALTAGIGVVPASAQTPRPPVPVVPASLTTPAARAPAKGAWPNTDLVSLPREFVKAALKYSGVPYIHGGDTRAGVDCSGLVSRAFLDSEGSELPRGVEELFHAGAPASVSPAGADAARPTVYPMLHVGDLVFFDTESADRPRAPTHVGIYAGNGLFVHAASEGSRTGVIISRLESPYYSERFLGARRVVPWRPPVLDVTLTDTTQELVSVSPFPSREKMTIRVFNRMNGGGPMDLAVFRNGVRVLGARITPGTFRPSEIPLTPEAGTWVVRVSRLFKGRELQSVTFSVEE